MKKEEKDNRSRKVTVRFKESEYNTLYKAFQTTTKRKFSEYIRSLILNKKLTVFTRDQSLDLLVAELRALRTELSQIGNNYNQTVKKLHSVSTVPELRKWIEINGQISIVLSQKEEEIKKKIEQIADKWWYGSTAPKTS